MTKSKEEMDKERAIAQEQIESILSSSRPKNLQEGIQTGMSNIISGAIGAAGIAVIAPTAGFAIGLRGGGIIGGALGIAGGTVIGIVGAAAVALGGAVSGVTQITRGILATPESITAPRHGKWWNERCGKWIQTDMIKEQEWITSLPDDDHDILQPIQDDINASMKVTTNDTNTNKSSVKDMEYYDCLQVPSNAEAGMIKRQYYILARQYHPDKNPNDMDAAKKFQQIAEAYQVLSDPTLRQQYDTHGKDGLSPDKTSVVNTNDMNSKIDPTLLFAFLFGSDQFYNYIGRLSTATSALVGDSPKISLSDAKVLQQRRVTRLAIQLINKITPWITSSTRQSVIETEWLDEAYTLSKASFGYELVTTIGKCYNLMAIVHEGSLDSGHGLPTISQWAAKTKANMDASRVEQTNKMEQLRAGFDIMKLQQEIAVAKEKATSEEEKVALDQKLMNASLDIMLRVLWTTTVVDITTTIQETTQMVFFDTSVNDEIQLQRVAAVKKLGTIWMNIAEDVMDDTDDTTKKERKNARQLYEEAAFAAMLETVKRQDEAAHDSFTKT